MTPSINVLVTDVTLVILLIERVTIGDVLVVNNVPVAKPTVIQPATPRIKGDITCNRLRLCSSRL